MGDIFSSSSATVTHFSSGETGPEQQQMDQAYTLPFLLRVSCGSVYAKVQAAGGPLGSVSWHGGSLCLQAWALMSVWCSEKASVR